MYTSKKKTKILCTILLLFLMFISFFYFEKREQEQLVAEQPNIGELSLEFSENNRFHSHDFQIAIQMPKGQTYYGIQIHYTLDGSEPTLDSPVYTEPISLSVTDEIRVYILKAAISYQDRIGKSFCKTYFTGSDIAERFSLPIVSITVDSNELYDESNGIYTNYSERSDDWIRPAHVEIINTDGSTFIDQNIGLAISGVTSSTYDIKPFKLKAGNSWDSISKFDNIFNTLDSIDSITFTPGFQQIEKINTIKLKNGGSGDYFGSRLREVIGLKLAKEAGLTPVTDTYPAIVYLNGSYYDIMQMTSNYSANNLAKIYSLNEDDIVIFKDTESTIVSELAGKEYLLTADYNDPSVIKDFEETFDKENFFLYYAVEMLMGNTDWPQYNSGAWVYRGENISGNIYSDGRIRFLIYDLSSNYRLESENEIFENLLNNPEHTKGWLFHVLMNPEYKRYFVNLLCDLLSTTFDTDSILALIDEEYALCEQEDSYLADADLGTISELAAARRESVDNLKDKVTERIWFIRTAMKDYLAADYFNEAATYQLTINAPDSGLSIRCNSLTITDDIYNGLYYKNYPVLISAAVHEGYCFDYWVLNGQSVKEDTFYIMPEMITDSNMTLEAVYHQIEGTSPIISEISAAGANDWIELYNPYSNDIYLGTYYLSNDLDNLSRYQLPKIILHSGETIVIQGKNTFSLGGYYMNMSIRMGENFYLSSQNNIIDSVFVPEMLENSSYGRFCEGIQWAYFKASSMDMPQ